MDIYEDINSFEHKDVMYYAIKKGYVDIIKYLINENYIDIHIFFYLMMCCAIKYNNSNSISTDLDRTRIQYSS
jgi:hypothetical protein